MRPAGTLSFVGTATTIIECSGIRVLTDPNFLHRGQRAYLGHGLSSRRRTDPAWEPHQLPRLDGVVLSHLHGDHWDRVTRRSLPIVTTPHASRRVQARQGFRRALGLRPGIVPRRGRPAWPARPGRRRRPGRHVDL